MSNIFVMDKSTFEAGLPKLGTQARELQEQVQNFGVAAGQFCTAEGTGKYANSLLTILATKLQKPVVDWLSAIAPVYMDKKSGQITFSHKKAWEALNKQKLVPTGTEQKGEVPTALLEKLLPFVTGGLQAISWAEFKAPKAAKSADIDKDALIKRAKKLLADVETIGLTAKDIMPQAFAGTSATTPDEIAKVNLGNTNWVTECTMLADALDLCDTEEMRQSLILAISKVINNAIGNAAPQVKAA